jgi:hypothetical protein
MLRAVSRKQFGICDIMAAYDVSFSIGYGLRPGSVAHPFIAKKKRPPFPKATSSSQIVSRFFRRWRRGRYRQ